MNQIPIIRFLVVVWLLSVSAFGQGRDFLVLESYSNKGVPRFVDGNIQLARINCSPASTFKVVITWAGLETGLVTPDTKWEVGDRYISGTPRELNLRQALYFSSNDYFISLARKIGKEKLTEYVRKSGMFRGKIPEDWLGDEWRPVTKGGNLETTPMYNHLFMRKVAFGELSSNEQVSRDLINVLEWPTSHPMIRLYGKTGVWGGAVWYNGFGVKRGKRHVRTVFFQGGIEKRPEAIMKFYSGWKLYWKPSYDDEINALK